MGTEVVLSADQWAELVEVLGWCRFWLGVIGIAAASYCGQTVYSRFVAYCRVKEWL